MSEQWEYRVVRHSPDGIELATQLPYPTAELAVDDAKSRLAGWTATIERRPVGDWQPYDPEADQ